MIWTLAVYAVFNFCPKWVLREKYKSLHDNFSWKIPFLKLSGLLLSLILSFMLIFVITISTRDSFIKNSDAVYGFEFNHELKELGFQDGMRIYYINGEKIDRVSDILPTIAFRSGDVEVSVELNGVREKIILGELEKKLLLRLEHFSKPIAPIMTDGENEIKITTIHYGFSDVLNEFGSLWNQAKLFVNPYSFSINEDVGYITFGNYYGSVRSYIMGFSSSLIILVVINLLPLPGLSIGNFLISVIENLRKKHFNKEIKQVIIFISILCVTLVIMLPYLHLYLR